MKARVFYMKTDKGYVWRNSTGRTIKFVSNINNATPYVEGINEISSIDKLALRHGIDKYELVYEGETEYFNI